MGTPCSLCTACGLGWRILRPHVSQVCPAACEESPTIKVGPVEPCPPYSFCRYGVLLPRKTSKYVRQPGGPAPRPPSPPSKLPSPPRAPGVSGGLPIAGWGQVVSDHSGQVLAAAHIGIEVPSISKSRGNIYVSQDAAKSWAKSAGAGTRIWMSLSISGNGQVFLAGTSGGSLYTSSDGFNWTARATSVGAVSWYATAASYDGTRLVAAVAFYGLIYTSSDKVSCKPASQLPK